MKRTCIFKKIDNNYEVSIAGISSEDGLISKLSMNNQLSGNSFLVMDTSNDNLVGYNTALTTSNNKIINMVLNSKSTSTGFITHSTSDNSIGYDQTLSTNSTNLISTKSLLNCNGTEALPAYSFSGDSNTGIYWISADNLGISTNGINRLSISASTVTSTLPLVIPNGIEALPAYSFSGDSNTGIYNVSADILGISTNGINRLSISTTNLTSTLSLLNCNGTEALPAYSFSGDSNTGIYNVSADNLGITTNGINRLSISTASITTTLPFYNQDGIAAAPAYSFSSDTNSGLYWISADNLGITTNGINRLSISTASITTTLPFYATVGTLTDPSYSFNGDSNTGIYSAGTSQIGISTNATNRMTISTVNIFSTLPILNCDGLETLPAYSFSRYPSMGMCVNGIDTLGFSTNGINRLSISTTALTTTLPLFIQNGTAVAPAYSFSSDSNTGLYNITADTLGITTGGILQLSISTTALNSTLPIFTSTGTAATPSYSFTANTNTGFYNVSSNIIGFSTNGTNRLSLSTVNLTSTLAILTSAGTVALPSYSFSANSNTGIYNVSSNTIGFSTNGVLRMSISASSVTPTLPLLNQNGTVALPAISFSGDTNTGIYWIGADQIGISTGGVLRMSIATTLTTMATHMTYSNRHHIRLRNSNTQSIVYNTDTLLTFDTTDLTEGVGFTFTSNIFTNTSGFTKYYIVRLYTRHNGTSNTVNYHMLYVNGSKIDNYTSFETARNMTTFNIRLATAEFFSPYVGHLQSPGPITFGTATAGVDQTRLTITEMN